MKVIITEDQFKRVIVEYGTPLNTDEFLLNKITTFEHMQLYSKKKEIKLTNQ